MTRYAIKVVPPEWDYSMPLPFSRTMHDYNRIESGMRVLIYRSGVGIVGETEINSPFATPNEWPSDLIDDMPGAVASADYFLPLGGLYYRGKVIHPDVVRQILSDSTFPAFEAWRPIDAQTYQQLIRRLL